MGSRHAKGKLILSVFICFMVLFPVFSVFLPDRAFSDTENRVLASAPEISIDALVTGRFMTGFEEYISEQFPMRDLWVEGKTTVDALTGHTDNGRVFFGKGNRLYLNESIDRDQLDRNLEYIDGFFKQILGKYPDAERCIMVAPTALSIERDHLPANAPACDEQAVIQRMKDSVSRWTSNAESGNTRTVPDSEKSADNQVETEDNSADSGGMSSVGNGRSSSGNNVKVCDPTEALLRAYEDGVQVYYRTDHHWTADGAFAAYTEWADIVGVPAASAEEFEIRTLTDAFLGMADSKGRLPWTKPDSIKAYYRKTDYMPHMTGENIASGNTELDGLYDYSYLNVKNKYNVYMGGNYSIARIETGVPNGRTLLIVRDSFANCFVPLLTSHFERIILVDLRYYRGGFADFFEKEEVNSVLFLYSAAELANDRNMYGLTSI